MFVRVVPFVYLPEPPELCFLPFLRRLRLLRITMVAESL